MCSFHDILSLFQFFLASFLFGLIFGIVFSSSGLK